jgi:hypothetical protein
VVVEACRSGQNAIRPHSSLAGLAPPMFTNWPGKGLNIADLVDDRQESGINGSTSIHAPV